MDHHDLSTETIELVIAGNIRLLINLLGLKEFLDHDFWFFCGLIFILLKFAQNRFFCDGLVSQKVVSVNDAVHVVGTPTICGLEDEAFGK